MGVVKAEGVPIIDAQGWFAKDKAGSEAPAELVSQLRLVWLRHARSGAQVWSG